MAPRHATPDLAIPVEACRPLFSNFESVTADETECLDTDKHLLPAKRDKAGWNASQRLSAPIAPNVHISLCFILLLFSLRFNSISASVLSTPLILMILSRDV